MVSRSFLESIILSLAMDLNWKKLLFMTALICLSKHNENGIKCNAKVFDTVMYIRRERTKVIDSFIGQNRWAKDNYLSFVIV